MRLGIRKVSGKLRLIESRRRRKFLRNLGQAKACPTTLCLLGFNGKKPFLFSLEKLIWESEWDTRPSFVSAVIGSKCLKLSAVYDLLPHPNLSNLPPLTILIYNYFLISRKIHGQTAMQWYLITLCSGLVKVVTMLLMHLCTAFMYVWCSSLMRRVISV